MPFAAFFDCPREFFVRKISDADSGHRLHTQFFSRCFLFLHRFLAFVLDLLLFTRYFGQFARESVSFRLGGDRLWDHLWISSGHDPPWDSSVSI